MLSRRALNYYVVPVLLLTPPPKACITMPSYHSVFFRLDIKNMNAQVS
jgi:hypothetical protein